MTYRSCREVAVRRSGRWVLIEMRVETSAGQWTSSADPRVSLSSLRTADSSLSMLIWHPARHGFNAFGGAGFVVAGGDLSIDAGLRPAGLHDRRLVPTRCLRTTDRQPAPARALQPPSTAGVTKGLVPTLRRTPYDEYIAAHIFAVILSRVMEPTGMVAIRLLVAMGPPSQRSPQALLPRGGGERGALTRPTGRSGRACRPLDARRHPDLA